jgi:hypothetical protein
MKTKLLFVLRLIILIVLYFISFAVISSSLISSSSLPETADNQTKAAVGLLAVSILNSTVLAYLILRSQLAGMKLAFNLFLMFFGVTTLMSQMETAIFVTYLPAGMLPRLVLTGLIFALVICPLAVLVIGKRKGNENATKPPLPTTASQWFLRLSIIAIAYVILYFTFGYYLAWKNPAVLAYYQGTDPGSLIGQLRVVLRDTPWLPAFQFLRGLLWVALALPVIRMIKGRWWEVALAVSLCFSVLMNSQLLIPNPLMPTAVRMAHLLETATSNFIFAWVVVLVLVRWQAVSTVTR